MQDIDKLDVIPIVGIPGQGKTTLAWKVYSNEDISYRFPIRIWINISEVFNSRDVFFQILKKFIPSQEPSTLSDYELVENVRVCLENEKFLLVLDDVWSVEAWKVIKDVLPMGNRNGKVIITTREDDVGNHSKVDRDFHKLKFLTPDESWQLLQYEVFGNEKDCLPELRDVGYIIAKNCDGVPLTIIVIGGVLLDQLIRSRSTAESEWETVSKNVSEALKDDKAQLRITKVVKLSYQRLPDHLRECFVFLGVFPEDYLIPAKMLCGLWIAEGFVLQRSGKTMEESAVLNMNDLICRNLLKVEETNHMGKVKTCRVHDMIRAFCINICKEENLCQEVKRTKEDTFEPSIPEVLDSHRLSFRSHLPKFLAEKPCGPHVRSFMCFYDQTDELKEHVSVIPENFGKLRILESKCIMLENFPPKITKLVHLRYLTLYIETLKILPESITQLWNLQSLVIETKSRSITMKANLWKMVRLRYLKTKAAIVLDNKLEGEAGANLQTLNGLASESCTEVISSKAKNLKTLGISGKLADVFKTKFLEELHHLEKLKLVNSVSHDQTPEDMLHRLPKESCFPPHLKRLTLTSTCLEWKHMRTLAMIESLEALKLKDNAFVGVAWKVDGYEFPSLQLLLIFNADLVRWETTSTAFPKLRLLVVKNCENLKEIPECLGAKLEKLEIDRLRPSAVKSAKNIGETQKGRTTGRFEVPLNVSIGPTCDIK